MSTLTNMNGFEIKEKSINSVKSSLFCAHDAY